MIASRMDSGTRTLISSVHFSWAGVGLGILWWSTEDAMRWLLVAMAGLLGGCLATTSEELQQSKEPIRVQSARSPSAAIGCVARSYEAAVGVTVGTREGPEAGTWEATARTPSYGLFSVLYALARPSGPGSTLEVWISQNHGTEELIVKLRSC